MPPTPDSHDVPPGPRQGLALLGLLVLPVLVSLLLYATWRPFTTTLDQYALSGFVVGAALVGIALAVIPRLRRRLSKRRPAGPEDQ